MDKEDYLMVKSRGHMSFMNKQAKWTQSAARCASISRLNTLKNMHSVYMIYTTKPSLFRKLCWKRHT